jgi:1,4-dihydroxy-6-naphthoate synthase
MAHGKVDMGGVAYDIQMADVEQLNQKARKRTLDVTKLSFAALGNLLDHYGLIRSGAALGRGCGPLIVARPGVGLDALSRSPVAVPGLWTTAAMLLGLYADPSEMVPMRFDAIMPSLRRGDLDIGVIIHEGRFTYQENGLDCLLDLGDWWEAETGMPIPLGCISARRGLPVATIRQVEETIRNSVVYGLEKRDEAKAYIVRHAQEMAPSVIDRHIDLYVNDYTIELGPEGEAAVETLFSMAREKKLLPEHPSNLFAI